MNFVAGAVLRELGDVCGKRLGLWVGFLGLQLWNVSCLQGDVFGENPFGDVVAVVLGNVSEDV